MLASISCLLLLAPFAAHAAASSRLREHVLDLPGLALNGVDPTDPDGKHGARRMAGYFKLNRTAEAEMFYFFFESRENPTTDPLVLWMTGGPGCSSELAVFFENGPFTINKDLSLKETQYGWDVGHNLIFVDQPIGTGFSYSNDPSDSVFDEAGVAHDMLDFVREFLEAHPEFKANDVFVTGESYAGHYVPAVSHRLWQWDRENPSTDARINFKGLAIGNGLTDPAIQYGAYGQYAFDNHLIDEAVFNRIKMAFPACKYAIQMCNGHNWKVECLAALTYCQGAIFGQILMAADNVNVYDIRKKCVGPLCYDFSTLERYLAQPAVRAALGVGNRRWSTCDATVHAQMMGDWMKNYDTLLPEMLADGIQVMIYAGDKDLICNWLGNRRWVDALEWEQADDWSAASDFEWGTSGASAGLVRNAGPLTFVKVYDAGHMVPMDQPKNALDMLTRFTRNKGFGGPKASSLPTRKDLSRNSIRQARA